MNDGIYDLTMVRIIAKDIVNKIGVDNLYTDINTLHPNAPTNFWLYRISAIAGFIKNYLTTATNTKKLYIIEDPKVGENIYGLYVRHGSSCYIKINANLNPCWKRFATLKELCSLYIDHYDQSSTMKKYDNYLDSLNNAFTQKADLTKNPNLDTGDLDSETFSILLATELMIPMHKRDITRELFSQIGTTPITMNDVAKSLIIPEFILDLYNDRKLIDATPQYDELG